MAGSVSIKDRIVGALADHLKRDTQSIKGTYRLRDDLGLDSMATIELLYRIEEAFNIQIPDRDLPGLVAVNDVVHYVETRVSPPQKTVPPQKKTATGKHKGRSSSRKG